MLGVSFWLPIQSVNSYKCPISYAEKQARMCSHIEIVLKYGRKLTKSC